MTSKKIFVNLSRPKNAKIKGGSSKNIVERTKLELITTNISSASNDKKTILYWKKSKEVKLIENVWYVKDREGEQHLQIYLYVDIPNHSTLYEMLGKVIYICLIHDTEFVYVLTKPPKSHDKIKYQLSLSLYDTTKEFTKMCKQIINDIAQDMVSIVIYICVLHYCNCIIIFL